MGFLSKLRSKTPDDGLVFDDCYGDSEAHRWRALVDAGDTDGFRSSLETMADTERRDFLILTVLRTVKNRSAWIDAWVRERPGNALARVVAGEAFVNIAWDARGDGRARTVSDRQFDEFFGNLDRAWSHFEAAIALDPTEGTTYALMIDCAKGLEVPTEDRVALYERAQEFRPWQQIAHRSMVQALSAKWSGSTEAMFAFARQTSAAAPLGSSVHVVVPEAHMEADIEQGESKSYWRVPAVRDEIVDAAARSIDLSVSSPGPWDKRDRNAFACAYWLMGEKERARREFELIGPVVAGPFSYWPDPVAAARKARREVGLA